MARTFNGTNTNYLEVGDVAPTDITGQYLSVFCWFRPTTVDANERPLVAKANFNATQIQYILMYSTGGLGAQVGDASSFDGVFAGTVKPSVWQPGLMIKNGNTLEAWLSGSRASASSTRTIQNTGQTLRFGCRTDGLGTVFVGDIANVAIWAGALSDDDALKLMNGADPRQIQPLALRGYWPLDDYLAGATGASRDLVGGYQALMTGSIPLTPAQLGPSGIELSFSPPISVVTTDLVSPGLNIGVGLFPPDLLSFLSAPFLNIGVGLTPPVLTDEPLPPFVPPPLPATQPAGTPVGPYSILPPLSSGGLAGIRFYDGPPWRWLITDLAGVSLTFLDHLAIEAVVTYGLDKPWEARLSMPSDNPEVNIPHTDGDPFVSEGNRLLYGFRREGADGASDKIWKCRFAGKILQVEDAGEAEDARTTITAWDPWQILYQRPMVNFDGEFPDLAKFFSFNDTQVGVIALTFLRNTIVNQGDVHIDVGDTLLGAMTGTMPGTSYWGSPYTAVWSGRTKSEYENTTAVDCDTPQGMMVAETWQQVLDYGSLDLMLTPIYDPFNRPGVCAELSIYNKVGSPQYDAVFAWDKPGRNLRAFNSLRDGTKRANVIRYYADETGPGGTGGPPVGGGIPIEYGPSILKYEETWHEQSWPGKIQAAALAMAELQLDLLANGIHTINVTPAPERMPFLFTEWFLGDVVPVYTSNKARQENAGFMRIYGIVLNIDENSYEQVPQVLTSPDSA